METKQAYQVAQAPHARVPARWLPFLFRVVGLKAGRTYLLAVTIPDKADCEPTWTVIGEGKVENG